MKFGLTGDPSDLYGTSDGFRKLYFSERTPDAVLADAARRFQPDSMRALNLDMTLGNRVTPERVSTSVLVLGGHSDGTYRRTDVLATAARVAPLQSDRSRGSGDGRHTSSVQVLQRCEQFLRPARLQRRPRFRPRSRSDVRCAY
jgi:hypothetical protein